MHFFFLAPSARNAVSAFALGSLALLSACGDSSGAGGGGGGAAAASPLFVSGSRLRATVADAGDGAVQFYGWHDSQLDVDCYFQLATDGETRCLPNGSSVEYGDPDCTTRIVAHYAGPCASPITEYANEYDTNPTGDCDATALPVKIRGVGASMGSGAVYDLVGGACMPGGSDIERFAVEDEIAPETFVKQVSEDREPHGDLGVRVLRAEDGASQVLSLYQTETGADCYPLDLDYANLDTPSPCIADAAYFFVGSESAYSDASCTEPTAYVGRCSNPPLMARYEIKQCAPPKVTLHELGAKIGTIYQTGTDPGTCEKNTDGAFSYEQGAEIDPASVPHVFRTLIGTGALVSRSYTTTDGVVVQGGSLLDAGTSDYCYTFASFEADPTRFYCLPVIASTGGLFVDSACNEPLAQFDPGECVVDAPQLALVYENDCNGLASSLREITEFTGSTIYLGDSIDCIGHPPSDIVSPTTTLYELGAEVPLESFSSYVIRTE